MTSFFPGAPDLAIEVRSPSDRDAEVRAKVADYLAAGTRLVWVIDPDAHCITVYRSLLCPVVHGSEDMIEGEEVLPEFAIRVSEMFEN